MLKIESKVFIIWQKTKLINILKFLTEKKKNHTLMQIVNKIEIYMSKIFFFVKKKPIFKY